MANTGFAPRIVKSTYSYSEADERRIRLELAACYRLIAHFRMTDLIYTHRIQRGAPQEFTGSF